MSSISASPFVTAVSSAVILMRLGRLEEASLRLNKIVEVDERDVLGAAPLLAVIAQQQAQHEEDLEPEVAR